MSHVASIDFQNQMLRATIQIPLNLSLCCYQCALPYTEHVVVILISYLSLLLLCSLSGAHLFRLKTYLCSFGKFWYSSGFSLKINWTLELIMLN